MAGLMMGVWFTATSLGNKLAGWAAGFYQDDASALFRLFGITAIVALAASAVLALMVPMIRRLTGQPQKESQ